MIHILKRKCRKTYENQANVAKNICSKRVKVGDNERLDHKKCKKRKSIAFQQEASFLMKSLMKSMKPLHIFSLYCRISIPTKLLQYTQVYSLRVELIIIVIMFDITDMNISTPNGPIANYLQFYKELADS